VGNVAVNEQDKVELINGISREIAIIKAKIDSTKNLYNKLDELIMALKDLTTDEVFLDINENLVFEGKLITLTPQYIKVVDNFETRNVVFKSAIVRRFEVMNEAVTERAARNLK
jgi:hypothetical protein